MSLLFVFVCQNNVLVYRFLLLRFLFYLGPVKLSKCCFYRHVHVLFFACIKIYQYSESIMFILKYEIIVINYE